MASPLAWQTIDIPVGAGMNEASDTFLLDPSQGQLEVLNGRFDKAGSIEKRYGYDYTDFSPSDTPHTLLGHGPQTLCVTKQGKVYRYDADNAWDVLSAPRSAASASQKEHHRVLPVELQRRGIVRSQAGIGYCDMAVMRSADLACYAWIDTDPAATGGYRIVTLITEASTGRVVDGPTDLPFTAAAGWDRVYVAQAGTSFVLVAASVGVLTSYYLPTSPTIGDWTSGTTVAAAGATASTNVIDLCDEDTAGSYCHIAYCEAVSTDVIVKRLDSTGAITQTATIVSSGVSGVSIGYHTANSRIWVMTAGTASAGGQARVTVLTSAYGVYLATTSLGALVGGQVFACSMVPTTTTTVGWCAWQEDADATNRRCVRIVKVTDAGVVNTVTTIYNYCLAAHGFYSADAALPMFPVAWQPDDRTTGGGAVLPTAQPLGMVIAPYNFASSPSNNPYGFGCVTRFGVDRYKWAFGAAGIRQNVPSSASVVASGVTGYHWATRTQGESSTVEGVDSFSVVTSAVPLRRAAYEGCEYLAAGALFAYDGQASQESTPHLFPEQLTVVRTGAGNIPNGAHAYVVVWEWEDAQGVLRRSAPSPSVSLTEAGGGGANRITFCEQAIRAREGAALPNLRAAVYRTLAGEAVYHLVTRVTPTASGVLAGDVYVDDNVADTTIDDNETLYTTGGVLENAPAPPCTDVLIHKNRAWVIDAERRNEICPSKLLQTTAVAPEFANELRIRIPRGEATALASLDDKTVIFTADEIFVVYGEGPNDTGQQGSFSEVQTIATGVGCTDRCSVVSGDFGVVFRSRRGLELLSRSLQVVPGFGEAMQTTLASTSIMAATVVAAQNQVRIQQGATWLVWDYVVNAWSKWTMGDTAIDGALIDGTYKYLAANAHYTEASDYGDGGSLGSDAHITLRVITPWIKLAGLQGYKRVRRVWLLGRERGTRVTWRAKLAVDYVDTAVQTESAQASGVAGTTWQRGIHVARQKCEALRVTFEDLEYAGEVAQAAEGITLTGLALECGGKKGLFRLPAASKT